MAPFSKPAEPPNSEQTLPTKRKRTLTSKITDEDNVHEDAIKRRKLAQLTQPPTQPTRTTSSTKPPNRPTAQSSRPNRQPSVEVAEEEEDHTCHNAGQPQNPSAILEEVENGSDSGFFSRLSSEGQEERESDNEEERSELQEEEETDEQELSNVKACLLP